MKLDRASPLAERAYKALKQMIVNNELAPGQSLTESGLADSLGISRSPVRAALARLHEERFLETERWNGLRVAPLDVKYVRELYELRTALEGLCARKSSALISDQDIETIAAAMESSEPSLRAGDSREWDAVESRLHALIVEHCGNDMLRATLDRLQDHWARVRNAFAPAMANHKLDEFGELEQILEAMRTRDPAQLQKAMEAHLSRVAARFLDAFPEKPPLMSPPWRIADR